MFFTILVYEICVLVLLGDDTVLSTRMLKNWRVRDISVRDEDEDREMKIFLIRTNKKLKRCPEVDTLTQRG
mgnify:CR=1 FL=1